MAGHKEGGDEGRKDGEMKNARMKQWMERSKYSEESIRNEL